MKFVAFTFILLASKAAFAGCPSLEALDSPEGNCQDNGNYVDAGIACFLTFENLVKEKAGVADAKMKKSNQAKVMGDKNSQSSDFLGAMADFKISASTLDQLIAMGKTTLTNIDGYAKNIYFPEDFDAPSSVIGPPWSYAMNTPCYGEPHDMLKDMKERTQKYIGQLEAAKKAVTTMNGTSTGRDENIDQVAGSRLPAASTKGKGSAALAKKKNSKKDSTVTGEIHNDTLPQAPKK